MADVPVLLIENGRRRLLSARTNNVWNNMLNQSTELAHNFTSSSANSGDDHRPGTINMLSTLVHQSQCSECGYGGDVNAVGQHAGVGLHTRRKQRH